MPNLNPTLFDKIADFFSSKEMFEKWFPIVVIGSLVALLLLGVFVFVFVSLTQTPHDPTCIVWSDGLEYCR